MKSENSSLFSLVHDYLKIYLPRQRKVSPNTIRSYRKALEGLLDYVKERRQIQLSSMTFEHLTAEIILSFLEYLETECVCSALTCNTRFAAIRAFMDYAADRDVTLVATLGKLRKIPFKKSVSSSIVDYMSMEAITAIVEQTDANTAKGLRDRFFIMLMYDTGARVQEMLDIKLCDLQLGRSPKITLYGKGNKTRVVPLMQKTVQHLQKYLSEFHTDATMPPDTPLFYSVTHGIRNPLTDRLIRYRLHK